LHPLTESQAIGRFRDQPRLLRLRCGIQHYAWGDPDAIPRILTRPNPEQRPFAELWAGAHPDLPATALVEGTPVPLDRLVSEATEQALGRDTATRFDGELPFLLKILAAAKPLSIQAHPDQRQALAGFERENREHVPLNAAERSYHDPHHKPELLVALTDFYSLRGFKPLDDIARTLVEIPELAPLARVFRAQGEALAPLYASIMHLGQSQVNALLSPLLERLEKEDRKRRFTPEHPYYWLLRADREYSRPGHRDHGLFSLLLLNLVHLRPGQAIYLPAGELHAYLRGVGIELMANSNNVLRGGLTHKFVDVDELLQTLSFRAAPADIIEGIGNLNTVSAPAPEYPEGSGAVRRGRAGRKIGPLQEIFSPQASNGAVYDAISKGLGASRQRPRCPADRGRHRRRTMVVGSLRTGMSEVTPGKAATPRVVREHPCPRCGRESSR
jgi:mannose-6-phosphate isomerase class I